MSSKTRKSSKRVRANDSESVPETTGKPLPPGTVISHGWAKPDDPIYREGWSIHMRPLSDRPSSTPTESTPATTSENPEDALSSILEKAKPILDKMTPQDYAQSLIERFELMRKFMGDDQKFRQMFSEARKADSDLAGPKLLEGWRIAEEKLFPPEK